MTVETTLNGTSRELVTINKPQSLMPSGSEWQVMERMAAAVVQSGLAPSDVKTVQQALTIMLKARELGVPPMQALSSIHVVKGKPTLSADLMVALMRRAGHKLWVVRTTDTECVMKGHRRGEAEHTVEVAFTLEDAKRANLTGKDTWRQYPAQLLYARCASRLARMIGPDELAGMYTPEEMGAEVHYSEDGQQEIIMPASSSSQVAAPEPESWPEMEEKDFILQVEMLTNGMTPEEVRREMGYADKKAFAKAIRETYPDRIAKTSGQMLSAALQFITDFQHVED